MGLLPLDQFLCWKLKVATFATAVYVIFSASFGAILEILDVAAQFDKGFEISGGFKAHWRSHVWEGWLACNLVMFVCHLIMVAFSVIIIFAVKRFPTYYEFNLTKGYLAFLIMYILVELGTTCYKYSWYGPNTFRLAFLVFSFLFWLLRTLLNITGAVIVYSRISEVDYEIQYGEKKLLSKFATRDFMELRSGRATPVPPGMRPPHSYA